MGIKLMALTINSPDPVAAKDFYSKLGLEFKQVPVKHGSQLFRASYGGLEISILGVVSKINSGTPSLGLAFAVADLNDVFQKIQGLPKVNILMEPTEFPDGTRAIVSDCDGNAVEISQTL